MVKLPWTLELWRSWQGLIDTPSIFRLRRHALREMRGALRPGDPLVLEVRRPLRGRVTLREGGSDILTFEEVVKEQVYGIVPARLDRCTTIIDLGANIGLASLYFATHFPNARVLAVEPHPETYDVLVLNLRPLVASGRGTTLRAAVWSAPRPLAADTSRGVDHYSAFATREPDPDHPESATIPGLTIQQIIEASRFASVDLLKVDIEGAEVELFKGDLTWLRRVRAIAIEFHGDARVACGFDRVMAAHRFTVLDGGHTVLAIKGSRTN